MLLNIDMNHSYRPRCGALLSNGFRHFCRSASCKNCTRHASHRRAQIFIRRCEVSGNFGATVSFIAPLDAAITFENFRRRLHDAIDHRRGIDKNWWPFGLIARWDGNCVRGVPRLADLGQLDFQELIGPCEITPIENLDAQTIAQTLIAGPFVPLKGSVKNIFLTVNPRPDGRRARTATRSHEPMPIIF